MVKELEKEINNLKKSLNKLETDIGLLQTGSKGVPYWDGKNAIEVNKALLGHFDHDKTLLKNLDKCLDYLKTVEK